MPKENLPKEKLTKNPIGKNYKKIIVVSLFVVLAIIVSYLLLPYVTRYNDAIRDSSVPRGSTAVEIIKDDNDSVFEHVGVVPDDMLDEYKKAIEGGWDGYWKDWKWDENIIYAHIKEVIEIDSQLLVYVSTPDNVSFSKKDILVSVSCPKDKTVAIGASHPVGQEPEIIGSNFNIIDKAKKEDILITYCLEEECINVGKQCILVSR